MILRVGIDMGGCISKFPDEFFILVETLAAGTKALQANGSKCGVEVWIVSDMHPKEKIMDMLLRNGWNISCDRVVSADYKAHGEFCKAVVCKEHGIDVLIDDFIGYVCTPGAPKVRLLVMPDASRDYYHSTWVCSPEDAKFGRRNPSGSKRPPEDK